MKSQRLIDLERAHDAAIGVAGDIIQTIRDLEDSYVDDDTRIELDGRIAQLRKAIWIGDSGFRYAGPGFSGTDYAEYRELCAQEELCLQEES